jgi:Adenine-specific methyltransferase EcoRI
MGSVFWFTNLDNRKRHEDIILFKTYYGNESDYPTYDNYNAIEVSKVTDIPIDYKGTMGVPLTFIDKYNPNQFEICGTQRWFYDTSLGITNGKSLINGKETYDRIFIKNKRL